jgi:hypothetical protein
LPHTSHEKFFAPALFFTSGELPFAISVATDSSFKICANLHAQKFDTLPHGDTANKKNYTVFSQYKQQSLVNQ